MELDAQLGELSSVVHRLESSPDALTVEDLRVLEATASALSVSSADSGTLDEVAGLLSRTSDALAKRRDDELTRAAVLAVVRLVHVLVRHLQRTPVPSTPPETEGGLGGLLRSRRHAAAVFREISLGKERPTEVQDALDLGPEQVHRVLRWGVSGGLLSRTPAEKEVIYRLTRLGEISLEAFDEPAWLRLASVLIRAAIRGRSLRSTADEMAAEVAELTALPQHQAQVSVGSVLHDLRSPLVTPLGEALSEGTGTRGTVLLCPVIYPRELPEETEHLLKQRSPREDEELWIDGEGLYAPRLDAQAEHLVRLSLHRAGFGERTKELSPQRFSDPKTEPWLLPLTEPIISLSSPMVSPVTLALLFEYGVPIYFDDDVSSLIYWDRGLEGTAHRLTQENDFAMLIRIWDDERGLSHFVLAGLKPSGTYAACNYFYENVDQLLKQFSRKSFALILRARRGYAAAKRVEPEVVEGPHEIRVTVPREEFERLDIRYLDALPVVARGYLDESNDIDKLLDDLAGMGVDDRVLEIVRKLKSSALTQYVRARYFAAVFQYLGIFEEMLIMLLARLASQHVTDQHKRQPLSPSHDEDVAFSLLKAGLNIATYSTRAVVDLLKSRDRLAVFVRAALGDGLAMKQLERDCRQTENEEGLRNVYPDLV